MLKKSSILIFLSFASFAFTQAYNESSMINSHLALDNAAYRNVVSKRGQKTLSYDEVQGSPYLFQHFSDAKISNIEQVTPVRYNAYADEFEFQKQGNIYVIPKSVNYFRIETVDPKLNFVLLNIDSDLTGYFIEVVNGKNKLYKKNSSKFIDSKVAESSYGSDKPAAFKPTEPAYYIIAEKTTIKQPKKTQDIINVFLDKKDLLNDFFKNNKIKFNREEDLIKLVNFLNNN